MQANRIGRFGSGMVTAGLTLPLAVAFWDVTSLSSLADGAAVTNWADSLGHGWTLTPPGAAPLYRVNSGKPSVNFNGTTMRLQSPAGLILPQPFSILCIVRAVPGNYVLLSGGLWRATVAADGTVSNDAGNGLNVFAALQSNTWTAVSMVVNGGASVVRCCTANLTAVENDGDAGSAVIPGGLFVGGNAAGDTFFVGDLAQIVVCATALSPNDIAGYEQYARTWVG